MPQTLAAMLPYIPPGLARALLTDPTLAPHVEQFPAAVLFADISGFTPLTEALAQRGAEGPEEMTRLLNAYFSRLIVAIEAEGGEVVKFSGDALTALFPATAESTGHAAAVPYKPPPLCTPSWAISPPCRPAPARLLWRSRSV
jgi:class 3 adenylate cyclase